MRVSGKACGVCSGWARGKSYTRETRKMYLDQDKYKNHPKFDRSKRWRTIVLAYKQLRESRSRVSMASPNVKLCSICFSNDSLQHPNLQAVCARSVITYSTFWRRSVTTYSTFWRRGVLSECLDTLRDMLKRSGLRPPSITKATKAEERGIDTCYDG